MPPDNQSQDRQNGREIHLIQTEVALINAEMRRLRELVASLVTRPEFTPVKMLVYGMAGSVLAGVLSAILAKVIMK